MSLVILPCTYLKKCVELMGPVVQENRESSYRAALTPYDLFKQSANCDFSCLID